MSTDPEGFLFPDTYYFTAGTTDLDLLRQAYQRMVKKLAQAWAERDPGLPHKTSYEARILFEFEYYKYRKSDETREAL